MVRCALVPRCVVPWCHGALVPRCHGAMVPGCHGATMPWCHGTTAPWWHGAMLPLCHGAMLPRCHGAMVPRRHCATVPWCHGAILPRGHGALVPWCHGALVPWCPGAMVPWCHAALVPWCHTSLVLRWHGATVPWCHGAPVPWRHGAKLPWCLGAMVPGFKASSTVICKERRMGQIGVDEGSLPTASTASEPLDIVCLTVWNGAHASLEKYEANSREVSSQHLVGFFKDGCTNLLWRRAARWLDWMGRDEPERQRAESQWIVAARPLCHLQHPVAYLSRLQRILPAARWKLYFNCTLRRPPRPFHRGGLANDMCPWGLRPLLRVGKWTVGTCVACSPDSDLEAFSHNPAHGSLAPLAFSPSAMTNYVNQRFLSY
ncbi:hypothetical protein CQW23_32691 [Capsicum baccatum]|uniref:Uncharacterized protein n=1 Tax=Capsicum baccatum TaxID=33114 RepID=A0A2G2V402_CAPBA|nr:hypothetical protein CQW23_32691 [Capsicum baccatum]